MGRESEGMSMMRAVVLAGIVHVGCYLGASLGTWLRFPEIGTALLFPPYAFVTVALWRSPPRYWWLILLAASTGNFLPHRVGGASVTFVLLAEVVNYARALVAAIGLRRFAGCMRTTREMVAYLAIAVGIAPCIGGLGGGLLVTTVGTGSSFVLAWQQWWLSNAITAVTILPILTVDIRKLAAFPRRRLVEIAVFVIALIAATAVVHSYFHPAHMYWALPFLLLATARFGAPATSAVLLVVTALSIWDAMGSASLRSSEHLLELQVFLIEVSIPLLLLSVLLDQQRQTAAQLTESRRQYRSVVEDQTEMICRFRTDGTLTFANRAYGEAFAVADPVGRSIWDLVSGEVRDVASAFLARVTPATPQATLEANLAPQGTPPRWQQWQVRGLFDPSGTVVEYQAVGRDTTDRKRAEEEHRELEARRSVEAVLRENDRRKDEFLAMLGHELRNPLAPIGIAVEVLISAPPGSGDAAWARESISRQLRKMTRLIDDLLDLSRVTLGRIQLQLDSVELATVISNAIEETRPLIDSFGHLLIVKLPDKPVWLRADGVRLTQVVANLLHNAAKYTERGGRIEIAVERGETGVRLTVRDNGIGLDPDSLETIFELFSQMPAARERAQGGLGIGLTLVKRLVELHGGTVTARSEGRNRGSEMCVHLPASAEDSVPPSHAVAAVVIEAKPSLRVLAVDDNVDIARGLAAVLGLWGHTVRTAHDGVSALEVATAFAPHVVLLDLGLPGLDGLEVARQLRERADQPPALLLSMSGFGHDYVHQRVGETGFHHHMVKPIDLEWLRALLESTAKERLGLQIK